MLVKLLIDVGITFIAVLAVILYCLFRLNEAEAKLREEGVIS